MNQPGLNFIGDNYLTCDEIHPNQPINVFGRLFYINGVDEYTANFYAQKLGRSF